MKTIFTLLCIFAMVMTSVASPVQDTSNEHELHSREQKILTVIRKLNPSEQMRMARSIVHTTREAKKTTAMATPNNLKTTTRFDCSSYFWCLHFDNCGWNYLCYEACRACGWP